MQKRVHSIAGADANGTDANVLKLVGSGQVAMQVAAVGTFALTPEATMEDPSEADAVWIAVKVVDVVADADVTTFAAAGAARVNLGGFGGFRLRQASGTGTPTTWVSEALVAE